MTWEEIHKEYVGQWILIQYDELDEHLNVITGEAVAHSPAKEEIYRQLLKTTGQNIAIEHAGAFPADLAAMFNL